MDSSHKPEIFSTLSHLIGIIFALISLILLVVYASGSVWHVVSFAIFGSTLLLLYTASTLYHAIPSTKKIKEVFRRLDHASVFLLIAGTYTPVCLIPLFGAWGWSLFGVIWGLGILGFFWKLCHLPLPHWLSVLWYVVMGWSILIAVVPLLHAISLSAFLWLLVGGLSYTIGVIFFTLDTKFWIKFLHGHDIFHIFVLLGSFSHVWFMWRYIL